MKPETEQNLATLEVLTDGLSFKCEGFEPYGIMAWEVEEKGEFSFLNFFLDVEALRLLSADELKDILGQIKFQRALKEYRELIRLLGANLSQLQFYSYQAPYLSEKHTNYDKSVIELIIIGLTSDGEWLAFAPSTVITTEPKWLSFAIPSQKITEATAKLIEKTQIITGDFVRKNRGEKMVLSSQIAVGCNLSNALEKILDLEGYISVCEIDYFWDIERPEKTDKYYDLKMQEFKLKQFFNLELIDGRVYNLDFEGGEYRVHYILGKNNNGDWMGAFTDTYCC